MWYLYTVDFYSAMKKNDIILYKEVVKRSGRDESI
jgi:hypothetical protein